MSPTEPETSNSTAPETLVLESSNSVVSKPTEPNASNSEEPKSTGLGASNVKVKSPKSEVSDSKEPQLLDLPKQSTPSDPNDDEGGSSSDGTAWDSDIGY